MMPVESVRTYMAVAAGMALLAAGSALAQAPPPLIEVQPVTQGLLRPQGLEIVQPPRSGAWTFSLSTAYGNTFSATHQIPDAHVIVDGRKNPLTMTAFDYAVHVWPHDTFYFIDAEVIRTDLQAAYSPTSRLSVGLDIPWLTWGGTGLDTLADHVHTLIGTTLGARPDFPYGDTRVVLKRGSRLFYADRPPGSGLGNISAWLSLRLGTWRGWTHRAMIEIKAPTEASAILGGDDWDWGLRWAIGRKLGSIRLDGGLGWTHLGSGVPTLENPTSTWHLWCATALEVWPWMDVDAMIRIDTSPYWHQASGQLHKAALEMAIGPAFLLSPNLDLQTALGENIPAIGIAPDFSIQLRLLWHDEQRTTR